MYNDNKKEKSKVIDITEVLKNPTLKISDLELPKVVEKLKDKSQKRREKLMELLHKHIKGECILLYQEDGECGAVFGKDSEAFNSLMQMLVTGIISIATVKEVDPIFYLSALFNATYELITEQDACGDCEFNTNSDECSCKGDCKNHCPKDEN